MGRAGDSNGGKRGTTVTEQQFKRIKKIKQLKLRIRVCWMGVGGYSAINMGALNGTMGCFPYHFRERPLPLEEGESSSKQGHEP